MAEPARPSVWSLARRFGPLALVAAALITALVLGLPHELSLHQLHRHRDQLEALVRTHPVLSVLAYIALYSLAVGVSLPGAPLVMTLTGGFLFGPWIGGPAAAISCTIGATIVFVVCRTAAGDVLRKRAGPTIARIEEGVRREAFTYILVLRLLPITPMALANLALGFIDIPLRTFVLGTFLGILPVSVIYAGLGSGLGKTFASGAHPHMHEMMRPEIILALCGLAVLSLAPIAVRQLQRRRAADR
jgi:uncharacterized membrane protein YdjX (TVP38/TMEM64 family)